MAATSQRQFAELALVDKDLLLKLLKRDTLYDHVPTDPDLKRLAATGEKMDQVLASRDMSPRSKIDTYNELLAVKQLHDKRYMGGDPPAPEMRVARDALPPQNQNTVKTEDSQSSPAFPGRIERGLTALQTDRARLLFAHLSKQNPDKISWDSDGQVTINGRLVKGVNISDLIVSSSRNRQGDTTSPEFVNLLKELDTPADYIGNRTIQSRVRAASNLKKKFRHDKRDTVGRFTRAHAVHVERPSGAMPPHETGAAGPVQSVRRRSAPASPGLGPAVKWEKLSG